MSDLRKLSFKRIEISLIKFNDVAVPHYVDVLKKHKDNILKYQSLNDHGSARKEQVNATRTVKQLKQALYEIEMLRNQVLENDLKKFDTHTEKSIGMTKRAIKEYLAIIPLIKPNIDTLQNGQNDSEYETAPIRCENITKGSINDKENLRNMQSYYTSWEDLQNEVHEIQELFVEFNTVVSKQREDVQTISTNVENSQENVQQGARNLAYAAKFKPALYPVVGALVGTCLGGPIGLIAGLKVGGVAAMGCGIIGFTGGHLLHKKTLKIEEEVETKTD